MNKRIRALLLCVLMVASLLSMAACSDEESKADPTTKPSEQSKPITGKLNYQVKLVNGVGQPYTEGLIVTFVSADGKEALATVNAEGVATKELDAGEYSIKVASTDAAAVLSYDENAKVTAEAPELELVLANAMGESFETINANSVTMEGNLSYDAYFVNVGSTAVSVTAEDRNYFLFVPTEAGKYELSVTDNAATIGVYGASTHYIMGQSTVEPVDGKISINVAADMIGSGNTGTTVFVIGLDVAEGTESCVLNIIRIGEQDWTVDQEPWSIYAPKLEIKDYVLPEGITLKEFDLTASTDACKLVLNEQDNCYHLNTADGPMVFVQLGKPMYGICLMDMVGEIVYGSDGTLMQTGSAPFRYMYDNGREDFFKEDYTDAMRQYVTARDKASGVYPLNKDLFYILPKGIEQLGWCREDTVNYLFGTEEGINREIAWMFLLMHEDAPVSELPENPDNTEDPNQGGTTENPNQGGTTQNPNQGGNTQNPNQGGTTQNPNQGGSTQNPNQGGSTTPKPSEPIEDNKDTPIEIGGVLEFNAEVKANHIVYYNLYKVNDANLTIKSSDAYIIFDGKTYEAKNGSVTLSNLQSDDVTLPVKIAIGNKGTKDQTFKATLSYPKGHRENPYTFNLGANKTETAAGNDLGVCYKWTATKTGTLTITIDKCSSKFGASITVTRVVNGIPVQETIEDGANSVSIDVKSGEKIEIIIAAKPNSKYQYPKATIETTATIA
ncbi:MAG: hypothetical protein E7466_01075 [Ruminococcaceae bacterium]|nr:hypothetical protein [Oscillospiraceae bacterium]